MAEKQASSVDFTADSFTSIKQGRRRTTYVEDLFQSHSAGQAQEISPSQIPETSENMEDKDNFTAVSVTSIKQERRRTTYVDSLLESHSGGQAQEISPSQNPETSENMEDEDDFPTDFDTFVERLRTKTPYVPPIKSYSGEQALVMSPSQISETNEIKENKEEMKTLNEDLTRYLPLYGAALEGDWESAKRFFDSDPGAMTAAITDSSETVLHVAVRGDHDTTFVSELMKIMPAEALEQTDDSGCTALFYAAAVGNTKVAKILVKKNPHLPQVWGMGGYPPLTSAASYGHRDTVLYLLSVTKDEDPSPFTDANGVTLIVDLIRGGLNGIALDLLKRHPKLVQNQLLQDNVLRILAQKPSAFASGSRLGYLQRLIYRWIPEEKDNLPSYPIARGDVENPNCSAGFIGFFQRISTTYGKITQKVHVVLWNSIKQLVPSFNHIHETKLIHVKTLEVVKLLCAEVTLSYERAYDILRMPLFTATRMGIHEFVKEIIKTCPPLAFSTDNDQHRIFQLAVIHRQDKIFSLICQMGLHKRSTTIIDNDLNNTLHLAGQLLPSSRVSGAALQMQREFQWFKVVENLVQPSFQETKNRKHKTPREMFTENHRQLVKEGEEWMKNIASSCSVVATLIATMMFAAAFTVPGGNNDQGIPIFYQKNSFLVFAISDALALFSSSTSVLMFLGILTSRYSEEDFLKSLPKKLIIALITLFISIASMMVAFSATLHMVLVHRLTSIVIPIALLACLPVTLFSWILFPLLVEIIFSTYGQSILQPIK